MRVSVVGLGRVGLSIAFAVTTHGVCEELVLVSRRTEFAAGEAHDLRHAVPFLRHNIVIESGDVDAAKGSDVIVIATHAAGAQQSPDRLSLAAPNCSVFNALIPQLAEGSPNAKLIVVSNPVDVLTYHAIRLSGFPAHRVMGTGTLLDSARFRANLAAKLRIHPGDLRAYIMGEHGHTQFPAMSLATVAGVPIDETIAREAFAQAIASSMEAFRARGYTNRAIAMATCLLLEAIHDDSCITAPVSTLINGYLGVHDVCLSVPVIVGREGIVRVLEPKLSAEEAESFQRSAATVRQVLHGKA